MKLTQFIGSKKAAELEIASIEKTISSTGEAIAILHLSKALDVVTGSQTIPDDATGGTVRVMAYDVQQVKIHENNFEAADKDFEVDDEGKGEYKGDLILDVAKASGEVWLREETFAASARGMRNENRTKRNGGLLARLKERAEKAGVKSSPEAAVVETK